MAESPQTRAAPSPLRPFQELARGWGSDNCGINPHAPNQLLVTTDAAARLLGMSRRWLTGAVGRGEIPAVRCGRSVRFDVRDLDAYIAAHKSAGPPSSHNVGRGGGR